MEARNTLERKWLSSIEEIKTDAIDLVMINVKIGDIDISLILVYFSTNDDYRNEKLTEEMKVLLVQSVKYATLKVWVRL